MFGIVESMPFQMRMNGTAMPVAAVTTVSTHPLHRRKGNLRAIMELDFFGTVALTKALLPSMLARKSGHIVPISSVVGYVGTPLRSTYSAAKHALEDAADALIAIAHDDIRGAAVLAVD